MDVHAIEPELSKYFEEKAQQQERIVYEVYVWQGNEYMHESLEFQASVESKNLVQRYLAKKWIW